MKFLQRFFQWDADQGWFAKGVSVLTFLFFVVVAGYFGVLGSFGVGNTYLAQNGRAAGAGWHVLGAILLVLTLVWDYLNFSDRIRFRLKDGVFGVTFIALIALIILVNCGFRFPFA